MKDRKAEVSKLKQEHISKKQIVLEIFCGHRPLNQIVKKNHHRDLFLVYVIDLSGQGT